MSKKNVLIMIIGFLLIILVVNLYSQEIKLTQAQQKAIESLKRKMPKFKIIWNSKLKVPLKIKGVLSESLRLDSELVKSYFADNFKLLYQVEDPDREIKAGPIRTDRRGFSQISLYQRYKNITVYGVSLKLIINRERRLTSISGKWIPGIDIETRPKLNQNQIMDHLISLFRRKYTGPEPLPTDIRIKPDKFELVIFNPGIYTGSMTTNYLAYHVILKTRVFFVDSQTGQVLYTYSNIQDTRDRETYNSNDCTDLPGDLILNETGPVGGASPDTETQNAHDFAGLTYNYYWNTHSRDSYDGSGATIVQTVHSGLPQDILSIILCCLLNLCPCECVQLNAAWVPSLNQVIYGDGGTHPDGRTVSALCNALDVVAHELTHAVTQYSIFNADDEPVGLDYSGQSGALNESFSDFFGAMIDRDDWLMAEDLFIDGTALRDMADPPVYDQPDHMDNYIAGGDVHDNSGIPNKVAYLIADGGIHQHSGIAVTGIGREDAEKILYYTLTNYLTQTSTFLEARSAALQSCEDLYPGDAAKYATVWNAFVACGICDSSIPGDCEPYSPIEDRDPVDIVILLDYSDSMNSPAEPGGRDKIEVLKDAAEIFLKTWEIFAVSGDRIDIVYFDSDVSPLSINLQPLIGNTDVLINELRTRPTGMFTAMGGGVQIALNGLSSGVNNPAIILFTNGIQNVNPMAVQVGDHYEIINSPDAWGGTSSVPENPGISLGAYGIPIHIIGIGQAAATSYHELLNDICVETDSLLHLTTSPDTDLRRFYLENLVEALSLGTLEMVDYKYGSLHPNQSISETFALDGAITRAAFLVHWVDQPGIHFPDIRIDGPHNTNLRPTRWMNGRYYRMAIFDFPYVLEEQVIDPVGSWRIHTDKSSSQNVVAYQTTLLVDETVIYYNFNLPRKRYWTGDSIIITAKVTEAEMPLTNLTSVMAALVYPGTALGSFLSVESATGSEQKTDLLATRAQSKLAKLLENPYLRKLLEPKRIPLKLYDNGNHENGDSQRGDGIYSAKVINTKVPGLYRFFFDVEGKTSTGWPIKRMQELSTIIRVKPDSKKTRLTARWIEKAENGSGTASINVIPYDRFGNYLGPDYGNAFHATTTQGNFVDSFYDVLDGSYEIKIYLPNRKMDPIINLNILNFEIYKDQLSKLFKVPERFGLSAHSGFAIPHGNFNNFYDDDFSFGLDFEFLASHRISLEALFGYQSFKSATLSDTYWINLSGNVKYFMTAGRVRPFINGGIGAYKKKNDSSIYFGINIGSGISVQIRPVLYFESSYYYHNVFTAGDNTQFSTAQIGLRFRF